MSAEPQLLLKNLFFHFQPVMNGRRQPVWFEALLRWRDASGIIRPPAAVLPELLNGSAETLDAFTAHTVHQAAAALTASERAVRISINLSPAQLCREATVNLLASVPRRLRRRLIVEITEEVFPDREVYRLFIGETASLGVEVVLDDLVPEAISERLPPVLPVSGVKIDRSLLHGLNTITDGCALARLILQMRAEGMHVTVEGVSSAAQLRRLQQLGAGHFQGFGLAMPRPEPVVLPEGEDLLPAELSRPAEALTVPA